MHLEILSCFLTRAVRHSGTNQLQPVISSLNHGYHYLGGFEPFELPITKKV